MLWYIVEVDGEEKARTNSKKRAKWIAKSLCSQRKESIIVKVEAHEEDVEKQDKGRKKK